MTETTEAIEAAAATPAAPVSGEAPLDFMDFDALDAGDIEDMEEYCGTPVMPMLAKMQEAQVEGAGADVIMAHLSARLFTALLGVAKRHQDPSFTPDRWRTIKLAAITGAPSPNGANGQVPTVPAAAGSRNGKPTSGRTRTPATPKSG